MLAMPNRKAITCYFGKNLEICLWHWFPLWKVDTPIDFPKLQLVQEREKEKLAEEQSRKPFLEVVTKEQFISESQLMCSANISPQLICRSHQLKIGIELSTPND
jgi:hypothetical protein